MQDIYSTCTKENKKTNIFFWLKCTYRNFSKMSSLLGCVYEHIGEFRD